MLIVNGVRVGHVGNLSLGLPYISHIYLFNYFNYIYYIYYISLYFKGSSDKLLVSSFIKDLQFYQEFLEIEVKLKDPMILQSYVNKILQAHLSDAHKYLNLDVYIHVCICSCMWIYIFIFLFQTLQSHNIRHNSGDIWEENHGCGSSGQKSTYFLYMLSSDNNPVKQGNRTQSPISMLL